MPPTSSSVAPAGAASTTVMGQPAVAHGASLLPVAASLLAIGASLLAIGTRAASGPAQQRQLDAEHPVLVARAGLVGVDVGAQLDQAAKQPALDLDLLVDLAGGLRRAAPPGEEQPASLDLERDLVDVDAGELGGHDRPGRVRRVGDVDGRPLAGRPG